MRRNIWDQRSIFLGRLVTELRAVGPHSVTMTSPMNCILVLPEELLCLCSELVDDTSLEKSPPSGGSCKCLGLDGGPGEDPPPGVGVQLPSGEEAMGERGGL